MHRSILSLIEIKLGIVLEEMTENPPYRELQKTCDSSGWETPSEDRFYLT